MQGVPSQLELKSECICTCQTKSSVSVLPREYYSLYSMPIHLNHIFHPLQHSANTNMAITVGIFFSSFQNWGSFLTVLQVFDSVGVNYWQVLLIL